MHTVFQIVVIKTGNSFVQITMGIGMHMSGKAYSRQIIISNWVKVAEGLRKSLTAMLYWSNHCNASALGNDNLLALF